MPISIRVIPEGGSATLSPCRLMAVAGELTDVFGRQFNSTPGGVADFGEGTAPLFVGTVTAQAATVAYFKFDS